LQSSGACRGGLFGWLSLRNCLCYAGSSRLGPSTENTLSATECQVEDCNSMSKRRVALGRGGNGEGLRGAKRKRPGS
jgi:hypothetical protein